MDKLKIAEFLIMHGSELDEDYMADHVESLEEVSDDKFEELMKWEPKSTHKAMLLTLFAGVFGAGYFYIGDTFRGLWRLFTFGGLALGSLWDVNRMTWKTAYNNSHALEKFINKLK